jgi:DNA-directed RNA polymerase specialized sigma24 family protein
MTNPAENEHGMAASQEREPRRVNRRKSAYLLTESDEFLLSQLPEPYVEILRQEGSMEEIARRLNIALGTVKSRTHRARAALDRLRAKARSESQQ